MNVKNVMHFLENLDRSETLQLMLIVELIAGVCTLLFLNSLPFWVAI